MAYMSQERKAQLAPAIKEICKRHGIKATLSVNNHSTLVLTVKGGKIDFGGDKIQVNTYWYRDHFDGVARDFFSEVIPAMNAGNHDNSDIQTDYFDVGWYININVGQWNKPYTVDQ